MFDISDIRQLRTIAELGSLSKAAERLNMSQPTLSKRLSRLEYRLGIELFHRHSGGMVSNDVLRYIIEAGASLEGRLRAIERHIRLIASLKQGSLNLGIGPIVEQLFFPGVLLDFSEKARDVRLSVRVGPQAQLVQWLSDGDIDVAVGPLDLASGELAELDLAISEIRTDPIIAVVRKDHPALALPAPVSYQTLAAYPCISPNLPPSMAHLIPPALVQAGFPHIVCDSYATIKAMVLSSDYFTGGPESLFRAEIRSGSLVQVHTQSMPLRWTSHCATLPGTARIPAVRAIVEIFQTYPY